MDDDPLAAGRPRPRLVAGRLNPGRLQDAAAGRIPVEVRLHDADDRPVVRDRVDGAPPEIRAIHRRQEHGVGSRGGAARQDERP